MRFGLTSINVGLSSEDIVALAILAESVGLESLWTFEHVMVPIDYTSRYPYSRGGKMPVTPTTAFYDPLITLAHLAAVTETLRLGTGVNILPQHNPLYLAKQVATLDSLSQGRLSLGLGVGWLREEFEALGVPFARRGARFDDYLRAMKQLWSGDEVQHESDFLTWRGFKSFPRPAQRPHPPIIIGGTSKAAFRRVVRHGDGWFAPNRGLEQLAAWIDELSQVAGQEGRGMASVEISAMWHWGQEWESIEAYEALGVSRLVTPVWALGPEPRTGLEALGAKLASR